MTGSEIGYEVRFKLQLMKSKYVGSGTMSLRKLFDTLEEATKYFDLLFEQQEYDELVKMIGIDLSEYQTGHVHGDVELYEVFYEGDDQMVRLLNLEKEKKLR